MPENVYRALLMHLRFASGVEGEVLRTGTDTIALDDTLFVVLSGSVGIAAVQKRVLVKDKEGGAYLRQVVTQAATVVAKVGEKFGGLGAFFSPSRCRLIPSLTWFDLVWTGFGW